jgi:Ca-activated chloride channel homolog
MFITQAARVAFEKEVRSGGNAALVEVTKGNSFKTRIYPIPPSGTISVKVTYLSDVDVGTDGANFSIPMKISTPVDQLKLKLSIRGI